MIVRPGRLKWVVGLTNSSIQVGSAADGAATPLGLRPSLAPVDFACFDHRFGRNRAPSTIKDGRRCIGLHELSRAADSSCSQRPRAVITSVKKCHRTTSSAMTADPLPRRPQCQPRLSSALNRTSHRPRLWVRLGEIQGTWPLWVVSIRHRLRVTLMAT